MKRQVTAGIFSLLLGAATLLLLVSILQSCHQGGHPHAAGTNIEGGTPSTHVASADSPPETLTFNLTDPGRYTSKADLPGQ